MILSDPELEPREVLQTQKLILSFYVPASVIIIGLNTVHIFTQNETIVDNHVQSSTTGINTLRYEHPHTCLFSFNTGNSYFFFQIPVFIGYSFPYFNKSSNCQVDGLSYTLNCLQGFIRLFGIIFVINKRGNLKIKDKRNLFKFYCNHLFLKQYHKGQVH